MTSSCWRLSKDVHVAAVGEALVFLDVQRDAYHCIPGAARDLRPVLGAREIGPLPEDDASALLEAGLVDGPADSMAATPNGLEPARAEIADVGRLQTTARERLAITGAALAMARHYHGRPLSHLIARVRHRPAALAARPSRASDLARRVQAYRSLLPWVPGQGVCVYRSFLLLHYLRSARLDATWVFGVRTWPFSAHCWLQAGDVTLDDPADYVARFTPILVV